MLTGLGVEFSLVADRAACALQEQVGAFAAGQFGLGSEVTCHLYILDVNLTSDAVASNASLAGIMKFAQTVGFNETATATPNRRTLANGETS